MDKAQLVKELTDRLRTDPDLSHPLAAAWEAVRAELQETTARLSPGYEYTDWQDGPEEEAMNAFLFWWIWGN